MAIDGSTVSFAARGRWCYASVAFVVSRRITRFVGGTRSGAGSLEGAAPPGLAMVPTLATYAPSIFRGTAAIASSSTTGVCNGADGMERP